MTDAPRPVVILGATCYRDAESAMHLSVWLARRVGGEILGLLVEDEAITAVAGYRATRILRPAGGTEAVTVAAMHTAFRRDAGEFRRRLEQTAGAAALDWRFLHRQGRFSALLRELAGHGDFVLLGFRRTLPVAGDVVLVPGPAPEPGFAALAAGLAEELKTGLKVLAAPGTADALGRMLRGVRVPVRVVDVADENDLIARLGRMSCAALLIAPEAQDAGAVAAISEAARCPVILRMDGGQGGST